MGEAVKGKDNLLSRVTKKKEDLHESTSPEGELSQSKMKWKVKQDALEEKQDKQAGRRDVTCKKEETNNKARNTAEG